MKPRRFVQSIIANIQFSFVFVKNSTITEVTVHTPIHVFGRWAQTHAGLLTDRDVQKMGDKKVVTSKTQQCGLQNG